MGPAQARGTGHFFVETADREARLVGVNGWRVGVDELCALCHQRSPRKKMWVKKNGAAGSVIPGCFVECKNIDT